MDYKEYENINKLMLSTIYFLRTEDNWKDSIQNIDYSDENIQNQNTGKYNTNIFRGFYSICEARDKVTSFEKSQNYLYGKVTYNDEVQ